MSSSMKIFTPTPFATQRQAALIVKIYAAKPRARALCVALEGELGAGKTTFVQGAARALGIMRPMPSPTFILMRAVRLPKEFEMLHMLYHFDWYRVHRAEDIKKLGWQDILRDPCNIVVVEWADKFPALLPAHSLRIRLMHAAKNGRIMNIAGLR